MVWTGGVTDGCLAGDGGKEWLRSRGSLEVKETGSRLLLRHFSNHTSPFPGALASKPLPSDLLSLSPLAGQLPGKVRAALLLDDQMKELAMQLKDEQSLMFFARCGTRVEGSGGGAKGRKRGQEGSRRGGNAGCMV